MDALRQLTSRKHDRPRNDMPSDASGSRGNRAAITKPIAAMSVEELLGIVHTCDSATLAQHWVPAMRVHLDNVVKLLNQAGGPQTESSIHQLNLTNALTNFQTQLHMIATNYQRIVEQAESLAERDSKATNERIKGLEKQVIDATQLLKAKDRIVAEYKARQTELQNTLHEVTRLLGTFIQTRIPDWMDNPNNEPRTLDVLRIMTDYVLNGNPNAVDYLRVPVETLDQNAARLREFEDRIAEFQETLRDYLAQIQRLGQEAEAQEVKYERAVKSVMERDHEIILLVQQNDTLTKQLQDNRAVLADNRAYAEEAETADRRYQELRGNMDSLKAAHELELDQRDAEIANLRQKLGSAREENFARREDVKNALARNTAILQSQRDAQATAAKSNKNSKALRFFGMEKDKYNKPNLPASHSTMGLSTYDPYYSTKELVPASDKDVLHYRPSLQTRTDTRPVQSVPSSPFNDYRPAPHSGTRTRSVSFAPMPSRPSPSPSIPPRADSLGYGSNPTSPISTANRDKPLPERPFTRPQMATARLAGLTAPIDRLESPLQAQITADYLSHGIMGQTAQSARRVLSKITEVSDATSPRSEDEDGGARLERVDSSDHSVASSDREVYRKSISALDALNSSTGLPYSETETSIERIMRGAGSEISPPIVSPPPRSRSRHPAATYGNIVYTDGQNEEEAETGVARVLHLRPGSHNLRRAGGTHDGILDDSPSFSRAGVIGQERSPGRSQYRRELSGESIRERRLRTRARESYASTGSSAGYRSEDSEPKTVAQMYHAGGKHIRG
ncbi:hypothetical protein H2200_011748 [Cladophialophora chaetospira]|uniref:Uncharacterized protein n=1 Tax=Cladophialophora chaetospira TaxID=386627 RepID=A0AA39CCV4_9EURO|nr:hypothetical protein H2200_011748 [Cladophialophora chaetospira]